MTELDTPLFIPPEDEGFPLNGEEDEAATSRLLHSPPRKRSRNLFENPEVMKLPKCDTSEIVRDEDYYFSDGSCIILVEDTLFNVRVHSFITQTVVYPTALGTQNNYIERFLFLQHYVFFAPRRQSS